jgi:tetratricopeptide (TPR) repeat protein
MIQSSVSSQAGAAGGDRGTGRRWWARSRRVSSAALFLTLILASAAVPGALAQEPEPEPEPAAPSKGTTVLVIPPANRTRPPEVQTKDEYVLRGGLDASRKRRGFDQASDIVTGYQSVLILLSTGRREDALEALYAFETAAMEGRQPQEISRLFDAEVEVVRALGRRDIESLVPVLMLHHDAYPMYVGRGRPFLAGHASRLAASMADLYAREGGTEGSRLLGARALASLGIYAQQTGVKLQAVGLMLHALDFDPDNEAALLGIATAHERSGNYHRTAERLLELLRSHPQHREGRLRMAVNLDRLGETPQARGLLEELVAEPVRDWTGALAYQELARIHRDAGNHDRAVQVLSQGLERFPEDGRIRTQLAFVLDHQREPQRALKVIQELDEAGAGSGPSPRRLYGVGPQEAYREAVAALEQSAAARMPRLARLVNPSGGDRPAGMP